MSAKASKITDHRFTDNGQMKCTRDQYKLGRSYSVQMVRPVAAVRRGCPPHHCPPGSPGSGSPTVEAHLGISLHMWTLTQLLQLQEEKTAHILLYSSQSAIFQLFILVCVGCLLHILPTQINSVMLFHSHSLSLTIFFKCCLYHHGWNFNMNNVRFQNNVQLTDDILQPHTSLYSLSPLSPASDVTVMVKLVGSSESTTNTHGLVTSSWHLAIWWTSYHMSTNKSDGLEQAAMVTSGIIKNLCLML